MNSTDHEVPDGGAAPETGGTGDERVEAALKPLADLPGTPVAGHVAIFEDVHERLQDVLQADPGESGSTDAGKDGAR